MSYLSNQLAVVLESLGVTQTALCAQTDISQSQLSRYLSGDNDPSLDAVEKICRALPERDRAEIARAWLYDQMPPSARELITIVGSQPELSLREDPPTFAMPATLREAFDFLERAAIDNGDVRLSILAAYRILKPA